MQSVVSSEPRPPPLSLSRHPPNRYTNSKNIYTHSDPLAMTERLMIEKCIPHSKSMINRNEFKFNGIGENGGKRQLSRVSDRLSSFASTSSTSPSSICLLFYFGVRERVNPCADEEVVNGNQNETKQRSIGREKMF